MAVEDSLQRRLSVMTRLVQISTRLNSTMELRPLLQTIIEAAAELLAVERTSVLLLDRNTRDLYFAASTGSSGEVLKRITVPLDQSIAGAVVRENRAVIVPDLSADPRHYRFVGEAVGFEPRALLGVPMRAREEVVGVLEAVNKREGEFGSHDVEVLTILADQAAVAIRNARLVEELRRAYRELGELDRMKSAFISIASHELRTPLLLILGYADLLKKEVEGPAREHWRRLLDSAVQLRNLLEDLTQLNYLETGLVTERHDLVDLREVAIEAGADIVAVALAKSQRLATDTGDAPLPVRVDRRRLTLAVTKLLANAIRFSPEGAELQLRCRARGNEAWIEVDDRGPGIPEGQEEAIFERFYQLEDHLTRRHSGMGVGLSIVRATAELHGGRSWGQNLDPGQGSRFTIALPLAGEDET